MGALSLKLTEPGRSSNPMNNSGLARMVACACEVKATSDERIPV